jgi:hypothetical protein
LITIGKELFFVTLTLNNIQLEALEIGGVLVSFQIGRARVYQYNPSYYFLNELKALLIKVRESYKPELLERLLHSKIAPRRKNKPSFF